PFLDHVARDEARPARGDAENVRAATMRSQITRARVAHGYGSVAREEELGEWLAHEPRPAHHHCLRPLDGDAVVVEDLETAGGRARHRGRLAPEEIAQAHRMQGGRLLRGRDGGYRLVLVHALGQRELEEDAVDRRIRVDLTDRL